MRFIPADAAARSAPGVRWAMAGIAAGVLAADQVSKSLVLAARPGGIIGFGWVSVRLVRNTGASGGLASGYPVLVTLAAVAVTVVAATIALRARARGVALCLAAVLGGAAGNLADRLFRAPGFGRGGVVDWIHFANGGGSLDVADLAIQFGVLGAVIALLADGRARKVRAIRQVPGPGELSCAFDGRNPRLTAHDDARRGNGPRSGQPRAAVAWAVVVPRGGDAATRSALRWQRP